MSDNLNYEGMLFDITKVMAKYMNAMKKNDTISYEQKQDLEDRILDLSFQIIKRSSLVVKNSSHN